MGDVHGKIRAVMATCEHAAGAGIAVLVSVGDFGFFPGRARGDRFLAEVEEALERYGLYLILVDGNHDDHSALRSLALDEAGMGVIGPRARYAPRGLTWVMGGVGFMAVGGAFSIDRWARAEGVGWWREEVLGFEDTNRCLDAGRCDVIVSHDCPLGVGRVFYSGRIVPESEANRATLQAIVESARPRVLVHGHYHQRYDELLELSSGDLVEVVGLDKDGSGEDLWWDLSSDLVIGS